MALCTITGRSNPGVGCQTDTRGGGVKEGGVDGFVKATIAWDERRGTSLGLGVRQVLEDVGATYTHAHTRTRTQTHVDYVPNMCMRIIN